MRLLITISLRLLVLFAHDAWAVSQTQVEQCAEAEVAESPISERLPQSTYERYLRTHRQLRADGNLSEAIACLDVAASSAMSEGLLPAREKQDLLLRVAFEYGNISEQLRSGKKIERAIQLGGKAAALYGLLGVKPQQAHHLRNVSSWSLSAGRAKEAADAALGMIALANSVSQDTYAQRTAWRIRRSAAVRNLISAARIGLESRQPHPQIESWLDLAAEAAHANDDASTAKYIEMLRLRALQRLGNYGTMADLMAGYIAELERDLASAANSHDRNRTRDQLIMARHNRAFYIQLTGRLALAEEIYRELIEELTSEDFGSAPRDALISTRFSLITTLGLQRKSLRELGGLMDAHIDDVYQYVRSSAANESLTQDRFSSTSDHGAAIWSFAQLLGNEGARLALKEAALLKYALGDLALDFEIWRPSLRQYRVAQALLDERAALMDTLRQTPHEQIYDRRGIELSLDALQTSISVALGIIEHVERNVPADGRQAAFDAFWGTYTTLPQRLKEPGRYPEASGQDRERWMHLSRISARPQMTEPWTPEGLQGQLKGRQLVVYRVFPNVLSRSVRVAAVVVTPESVSYVDLGDWAQVERTVAELRASLTGQREAEVRVAATRLFDLIWEPLGVEPGNHILISADNALEFTPFSALFDAQADRYLIQHNQLTIIHSMRGARQSPTAEPSRAPVVIFNPDYGYKLQALGASQEQSSASITYWAPLRSTRDEASAIKAALAPLDVVTVCGRCATKARVLSLVSPKYLHFATHASYSLQTREAVSSAATVRPTSRRSAFAKPVIVLAGANGDPHGGTLTALDVARMQLSGTELVVLSACETGLGDLRAGEGAAALHRAFLYAGAQGVVYSLWDVGDVATGDLMRAFYTELGRTFSHPDHSAALRAIQVAALSATGDQSKPWNWAAFQFSTRYAAGHPPTVN